MRSFCRSIALATSVAICFPAAAPAQPALTSGLFGGPPLRGELQELPKLQEIPLNGTTYHVQGIETDGRRLWATSVQSKADKGYLHRFALPSGEHEKTLEIQVGDMIHPGGICGDGGSIWIPLAEYTRNGKSLIQRRDKETFELQSQFEVADHIGAVAALPDRLIGANWDTVQLYAWDKSGKELAKWSSISKTAYQDMKPIIGGKGGEALICSGIGPNKDGVIERADLRQVLVMPVPVLRARQRTDRGANFMREGMAYFEGKLYLLPEDGPSRLLVYELGALD